MLLRTIHEFRGHIARLITIGVLLQEVGEEEYLQDGEHNEQFNQYDGPQRLAEAHIPEAVVVEVEGPVPESVFVHRRSKMILQIYAFSFKVPNDLLKIVQFFRNCLKN